MSPDKSEYTRREVMQAGTPLVVGAGAAQQQADCGFLDDLLGRCEQGQSQSGSDDETATHDETDFIRLPSLASHPPNSQIGKGNVALYALDGVAYRRPHGQAPVKIEGGGSSGVSDHGDLNGLSDDDHTQYLLADGTRSLSGALDANSNDINNVKSFDTGEAETDNETHIIATRGSDSSSTSSGTYINVFDGSSEDVRDEFSSSAEFTPDKTGTYHINITSQFIGSTSAGDRLNVNVRNTTDSNDVSNTESDWEASRSTPQLYYSVVVELTASKTYEVQATNANSSFKINDFNTGGVIRWSVVQ